MALQADVFSYLLQILNSDKFRGDTVSRAGGNYSNMMLVYQPVAGTCQCAIFTLMSVALEAFDESSLGNCEVCAIHIVMTNSCQCVYTGIVFSGCYGNDTPSP